jgi:AmmeMemoRadiSam system protein B
MMSDSLDVCRDVGEAMATAVKDAEYPVTIVASSDMSHYETDSTARTKDRKAIDRVIALDPEGSHPCNRNAFCSRKIGG